MNRTSNRLGLEMDAAVVDRFGQPPSWRRFPVPRASGTDVLVKVEATALSRLARGQASGQHYASGTPPLVPGVDGVGTLPTGERVYFAFPRAPHGSMAEYTVVDERNFFVLPPQFDSVGFAAIANPAMSSWAALRQRAKFAAGEAVLVNGAAGVAGRLAIRIARLLGAKRIVATARDPGAQSSLMELGADAFISLNQEREPLTARLSEEFAQGIDVVLDYVWGSSAECVFAALKQASKTSARRTRFVNIGSVAGPVVSLNAAVLRGVDIELLGTGIGSLSTDAMVRVVEEFAHAVKSDPWHIDVRSESLSGLSKLWDAEEEARVVFTLDRR